MGLRETMNNNPAAVTGGAVVLLLVALAVIFLRSGLFGGSSSSGQAQALYYDVQSKTIKLVPYGTEDYPNSPLDGSPETYEAAILACGECPEGPDGIVDGMTLEDLKAKGLFIGWLEKRDPNSEREASFNQSVQFRLFKDKKWYPGESERWFQLQEKVFQQCPGNKPATQCYPPMLDS